MKCWISAPPPPPSPASPCCGLHRARRARCIARAFANFASAGHPRLSRNSARRFADARGDGWTARSLLTKPSPSKPRLPLRPKTHGARRPSSSWAVAPWMRPAAIQIAENELRNSPPPLRGKGACAPSIPSASAIAWQPADSKMLQTIIACWPSAPNFRKLIFGITQVLVDKNLIRIVFDPAAIARPPCGGNFPSWRRKGHTGGACLAEHSAARATKT